MRKIFSLLLALLLTCVSVAAYTDPEPNPFATLEAGETVFEGKIVQIDGTNISVQNSAGQQFAGSLAEIFRYRAGGSVPDKREFGVGDAVRFIGVADGKLTAIQDAELLLTGVEVVGKVVAVAENQFTLAAVDYERYRIIVDSGTAYFSAPKELLQSYVPKAGDFFKVHGVLNQKSKILFVLTRDTYITLSTSDEFSKLQQAAKTAETTAVEKSASAFSDLKTDDAHRQAIGFVKYAGFVNGYPDGTFGSEKKINRAELAKILIAAKFPTDLTTKVETACFTDVETAAWFASFVCTAKSKGVIGGNPDGTFAPSRNVNLAEGVKIVLGAFGITTESPKAGEAWYVPHLSRGRELGIIPVDLTDPAQFLTRGEVAELIYWAVQHERKETLE